ncbi:MAG: hypothetical protein ACE5HB_10805 [Terriglobia bacterium]
MEGLWQKVIVEPLEQLWEQVLSYFPNLLAALVVLVVGLAVAWLARQVVYRTLRALHFDRGAERVGIAAIVEQLGFYRGSSHVAGQLAQGFVLLLTLFFALNVLGPTGTGLLQQFFLYLPRVLTAVLILVIGGMAAGFFARATLLAAVNARLPGARLLAGGVRLLIWILVTMVVLEHLGIGRTTVAVAFGVLFGGLVVALAIAFGLAGKELAKQVLESITKRGEREEEDTGIRHL